MFVQITRSAKPSGVYPADIVARTIGVLTVLSGATRGITEAIVPLDPSHFVVVFNHDYGGEDGQDYIAVSVEAAPSHVASVKKERATIALERLALTGDPATRLRLDGHAGGLTP